jgi:hypothetical protein
MIAQGKHYTMKHPPNDIDNLLRRSVESTVRFCHCASDGPKSALWHIAAGC